MKTLRMLLLLLGFAFGPAATAAPGAPREAHAAGFRYLVFETAGAGADAELPMIVGLHYSSARPETMVEYFDQIGFPVRVVLPQGPHPRRAGHSWFSGDAGLSPAQQAKATADIVDALSAFIGATAVRHPTRGKPLVMGISYGGDLSFLLAVRHPAQLRAAFPVAARLLPEWMPTTAACRPACPPIRAMHGSSDSTVPPGPMQRGVAQLRRMGFDATLWLYPGVAHDFDARMEVDFAREVRRMLHHAPQPPATGR